MSVCSPILITKWKIWVSWKFIRNRIPNSMKIANSFKFWKFYSVTSKVTLWIVIVNSRCSMKWLMNITNIMNQKSHGNRVCILFSTVSLCFNCVFNVWSSIWIIKPINKTGKSFSYIMSIWFEIEISECTTLIKIWLINKVPSLLVISTVVFKAVSKSSTLSEWMISFVFC